MRNSELPRVNHSPWLCGAGPCAPWLGTVFATRASPVEHRTGV